MLAVRIARIRHTKAQVKSLREDDLFLESKNSINIKIQ